MTDIVDRKALSSLFLQLFLFVESVNKWMADCFRDGREDRPTVKGAILEVRGLLMQPSAEWPTDVELAIRLKHVDALPSIDMPSINKVSRYLLRSAKIKGSDRDKSWALKTKPNLPNVEDPVRLKRSGWVYDFYDKKGFTTGSQKQGHSAHAIGNFKEKYITFFDQVLDPIAVAQNFILRELDSDNIAIADFYIQMALKGLFDLRYADVAKFALSDICNKLNEDIFGFTARSARRTLQTRSATLTSGLLLHEIEDSIKNTQKHLPDQKKHFTNTRLSSIGILLTLRFCRVLRIRYAWFNKDDAASVKDTATIAAAEGKQCVAALRPVEYMYLKKRIFGSMSEIPGLNFIFGGAIVPRTQGGRSLVVAGPTGSGKTILALQKLVNVACHGGLSVYFSFEESYQLIFDRLIAFGLLDSRRFIVDQAGGDVQLKIKQHFDKEHSRGLLLLFGDKHGAYHLDRTIKKIGETANSIGHGANWRALVIDSINALPTLGMRDHHLPRDSHRDASPQERQGSRAILHYLIDLIEKNGFLGIIISEEPGEERFRYLYYLGDSVINLGFDELRLRRWIEIAKARGQSFHQGQHTFRLIDGQGVRIYPSSSALRESLRRKSRSALSEKRWILLPKFRRFFDSSRQIDGGVREKCSTLIFGAETGGKTRLALTLATAHSLPIGSYARNLKSKDANPPSNVLVVNFRTAEVKFFQELRSDPELNHRWRLNRYYVHTYSPGRNVTANQIVGKVWKFIQESRRSGLPIDRIVFDEIESAEVLLPSLSEDRLFWPTIFELCGAEAITVFFVFGGRNLKSKIFNVMRSEVDYVIKSTLQADDEIFVMEKTPDVARGDFVADQETGLI